MDSFQAFDKYDVDGSHELDMDELELALRVANMNCTAGLFIFMFIFLTCACLHQCIRETQIIPRQISKVVGTMSSTHLNMSARIYKIHKKNSSTTEYEYD